MHTSTTPPHRSTLPLLAHDLLSGFAYGLSVILDCKLQFFIYTVNKLNNAGVIYTSVYCKLL